MKKSDFMEFSELHFTHLDIMNTSHNFKGWLVAYIHFVIKPLPHHIEYVQK